MKWLHFLLLLTPILGGKIIKNLSHQQNISSQNIQIRSIQSTIKIDKYINVASTFSQTNVSRLNMNAVFWSTNSKIQFDDLDTFVNGSFDEPFFRLNVSNCEYLYGKAFESLFFMRNTGDLQEETFFEYLLFDNANMTLVENNIEFWAISSHRIEVRCRTRNKAVNSIVKITSNENEMTGEKNILLTILSPVHETSVLYVNASFAVKYKDLLLNFHPETQSTTIYNKFQTYDLTIRNSKTQIQICFLEEKLSLNDDESNFVFEASNEGIIVHIQTFSQTSIDGGSGNILLDGTPVFTDVMVLKSKLLTIQMKYGSALTADVYGSDLYIKTFNQNVSIISDHQNLQITGGTPSFTIETENFFLKINNTLFTNSSLGWFVSPTPDDQFDFMPINNDYFDNLTQFWPFPKPISLNYTYDGCSISKNQTDCCKVSLETSLEKIEVNGTTSSPVSSSIGTVLNTTEIPSTSYFEAFSEQNIIKRTTVKDFLNVSVSSTIDATTSSYPQPNNLETDEFVIGHWFTTDKQNEGSGFEVSSFIRLINRTTDFTKLQSKNLSTDPLENNNDFIIRRETTTESSSGNLVKTSTENPIFFKKSLNKMFVLKLKIPQDVHSSEIKKNYIQFF